MKRALIALTVLCALGGAGLVVAMRSGAAEPAAQPADAETFTETTPGGSGGGSGWTSGEGTIRRRTLPAPIPAQHAASRSRPSSRRN